MPIVSTWVGVWWHQQNLGWIGLDHRHELPVGPMLHYVMQTLFWLVKHHFEFQYTCFRFFLLSFFKYYYFINDLIFLLFKTFFRSMIQSVTRSVIRFVIRSIPILSDPSFVDAGCVGAVKHKT